MSGSVASASGGIGLPVDPKTAIPNDCGDVEIARQAVTLLNDCGTQLAALSQLARAQLEDVLLIVAATMSNHIASVSVAAERDDDDDAEERRVVAFRARHGAWR